MKYAALLLSGHVRNYPDSTAGLNRLLESFKGYEIHTFCSFWNTFDTDDGPKCVEGRGRSRGKVDEDKLNEFYRPIDIEIHDYEDWRASFHYSNFMAEKPRGFPAHYYIINDILICAPQLFNIWRANQLKRAYEEEQCFEYDVVIRARPDFMPTKPFVPKDSDEIKFPIIYTEKARPHALDDRFCYGPSAAMDVFADIFTHLEWLIKNYDPAKFPYEANEANCQHLSCERIIHRWLVENSVAFAQHKEVEFARV